MINRNLVTSGFDTETLVSEDYLTYLLLAQIEAGRIQMSDIEVDDYKMFLHPPLAQKYERLYDEDETEPLPRPLHGSFNINLLPDEASPLATVAFHPNGSSIASGSWDGVVRFWDVDSLVDQTTFKGHGSSVTGVAFSPNGTRVASCSVDGTARLLDAESGEELTRFTGHDGPVFGVSFHRDGTRIASCGSDRIIRIWDVDSGAELTTLTGHSGPVLSVAFSPDGTRIVSGSLDGSARLWDLDGAVEPITLIDGDTRITSVAFRPDGMQIATGSEDRTVRLFDAGSGAMLFELTGHEGPISGIAFSPDGMRVASASQDRTIRVWDVENGEELNSFTSHKKPVLSVAFHPDGTRVASGSEDNKIRLWALETGVETVTFNVAFMTLSLWATLIPKAPGAKTLELLATLLLGVELEADDTGNGLESNHALRLSFLRFDDSTTNVLETNSSDVKKIVDDLRVLLDRSIPLGVAQRQQVHQIRMRKFVNEQSNSLGFYVNLVLRSGPEPDAYLEPRGSLSLAQDFRNPGRPLAFATSPGLFALLGPDAKFRQAEETEPGSGSFRYPLRKDPLDRDSDKFGRIKGIKIGPEIIKLPNHPPITTGRLNIDVHGEYTDFAGDPDFHLNMFLKPKIEEGLVDWDFDVSVNLGLLATLFLVAVGTVLTLLFAPGLAWGSTFLVGALVGSAVLKESIAEPLAARLVQDRIDEDSQASFLDALPFRVPATKRRWDPFYETVHEVVVVVDKVVIDSLGIAFEGTAAKLGKRPQPVNHVVIREEERDADARVSALRYRVSDFDNVSADLGAIGPGRDSMDFSRVDGEAEPLLSLTNAQISERIETGRLFAPIIYTPERIHLVDNQIDQLLCLSAKERGEVQREVIRVFRADKREEIIADEGDDIREQVTVELEEQLGRSPTEDEIDKAFDKRIEALVNDLQSAFEKNKLPDELKAAVERVLRFDLAPEEFIELQTAGVLFLDGKVDGDRSSGAPVIIIRHNADGTTTPYYRDRPDADPRDNLLSLSHYTPPYQPPQ
jgi:WD40 repeat protein